jgi:hypothetical protein
MTAGSGGHYRRHRSAFTRNGGRTGQFAWVASLEHSCWQLVEDCEGLLLLQAKPDGLFPRSSTSQERGGERDRERILCLTNFSYCLIPAQSMH